MQNSSDHDREEFDFPEISEISMHIRAASSIIVCAVVVPPVAQRSAVTGGRKNAYYFFVHAVEDV